jgi:hypothetical protein
MRTSIDDYQGSKNKFLSPITTKKPFGVLPPISTAEIELDSSPR